MSKNGDPDDSTLRAQLDTTADRADALDRLLAVAIMNIGLPVAATSSAMADRASPSSTAHSASVRSDGYDGFRP